MDKQTLFDLALVRIGDRQYTPNSNDPCSVWCEKIYVQAVCEVLKEGKWSFATVTACLHGSVPYPAHKPSGFLFPIPDDCLQIQRVFSDKFQILDGNIFVEDGGGTSLDIVYTSINAVMNGKVFYVADRHALFIEAVVVKLAGKLAMPVTGKFNLQKALSDEYAYKTLPKALHADKIQDASNDQNPINYLKENSFFARRRR